MTFNKSIINIRYRILIQTLLTIIPVLFLISYINTAQLKRSKEAEIGKLKSITNIVSSENIQIIEGARQLLISLSVTPEISIHGFGCNKYLNTLLGKYLRYSNFGVADANGNVYCSATPLNSAVNLSDRYFFQQTTKTHDFAIGEYVISKTTNQASLNFGYPSLRVKGVIYATLSLDWLNKLIAELDVPEGLDVTILDRNGIILAKNPSKSERVGQTFENREIVNAIKSKEEGVLESENRGSKRIYTYKKMGSLENGPFIVLGQDMDLLTSGPKNDFRIALLFSIFAGVVSVATGIIVGNNLITKTLTKLNEIELLKRDFISLVSHQIRTPITAIKWFTEILLSESPGKLNRKQSQILKDTHLSAKRMVDLIGTLLNISKLESGKLPINPTPTDICKMVEVVVSEMNAEFKNKKVKAIVRFPKKPQINVVVDPRLMRQVYLNTIHNAYKYSSAGGKVEIVISRKNKQIISAIKDHGIGIPIVEKSKLFQKFSRASNAKLKDTEGAGLGLYLSKLIMEAHGGKIGFVENKTGTTVSFVFPLI